MPRTFRRIEGILSAPLDRTLLMMSLDQGMYYEAAGTGGRIWELLAEPTTEEGLVAALLQEFEVDRETCAAEVRAFLRDLEANGLLAEAGTDAGPCG